MASAVPRRDAHRFNLMKRLDDMPLARWPSRVGSLRHAVLVHDRRQSGEAGRHQIREERDHE